MSYHGRITRTNFYRGTGKQLRKGRATPKHLHTRYIFKRIREDRNMTMTDTITPSADATAGCVQTITLTGAQLQSIASVTVAVASGKNALITPILGVVQITQEQATVSAVATDRYRAARVTFPAHNPDGGALGEVTVLVGAKTLTAFAKSVKAAKVYNNADRVRITVTETPGGAGGRLVSLTHEFLDGTPIGSAVEVERAEHFPPVGRLFPDANDESAFGPREEAWLSLGFLSDAAKIVLPSDVGSRLKRDGHRVRFVKSENGREVMAPIYVDFGTKDSAEHAEYLLQPRKAER